MLFANMSIRSCSRNVTLSMTRLDRQRKPIGKRIDRKMLHICSNDWVSNISASQQVTNGAYTSMKDPPLNRFTVLCIRVISKYSEILAAVSPTSIFISHIRENYLNLRKLVIGY